MASIGMLPRSLRSRGSVKDVWRHFVKDVMRLNTGFDLSGAVRVKRRGQECPLHTPVFPFREGRPGFLLKLLPSGFLD